MTYGDEPRLQKMWDAEETQRLLLLRSEGLTGSEIGGVLRRSRCSVIGKLWHMNRIPKVPQPPPVLTRKKPKKATFWTPEKVAKLRQLIAEGVPYIRIAVRLGCTMKAAARAADRHGLSLRNAKPKSEAKVPAEGLRIRPAGQRWEDRPVVAPDSAPVSLLARGAYQCSWVVGPSAGPSTLMCGAPVGPDCGSWCSWHFAAGHQARVPKAAAA